MWGAAWVGEVPSAAASTLSRERARRIDFDEFVAVPGAPVGRDTVFVLGRGAADRVSVEALRALLRASRHWTVVVADAVAPACAAEWRDADPLGVVGAHSLEHRLSELRGPLRARVDALDWLAPDMVTAASLHAARCLDGIPHPTVRGLAGALGCTGKNQLARYVGREFRGWTPRFLVAEFLRAVVARERALGGRTRDEIADALGFHDASTLNRALRDQVGRRRRQRTPLLPFERDWHARCGGGA